MLFLFIIHPELKGLKNNGYLFVLQIIVKHKQKKYRQDLKCWKKRNRLVEPV